MSDALTPKQRATARCLIEGHEWTVDRYVDVLTPGGCVVMAGWIHLQCRCGAAERLTNPEADWHEGRPSQTDRPRSQP